MTHFETILPGLHGISIPTPFEIGPVNVYVAEGDTLTLIDCATNNDESYRALADGLAALGYQISDIGRLIITHHHTDHLGLARRIVDESGAQVWAHPLTAPWLESPAGARVNLARFTDPLFREGGVPPALLDVLHQVSAYLERLGPGPVAVDRLIGEGDALDLVGCVWRVYHTPGHAGGMLCFFQPDMQVLIASDHLLRDVSSNPLIEGPDTPDGERPKRLLDYMREMERMAALGVRIAYTGHGQPVTEVRSLVESRLAFHAKRAAKIHGLIAEQPRSLYELARLMFPKAPDTQLYLTLSEVLGHLDILEREGRFRREMRDETVFYLL